MHFIIFQSFLRMRWVAGCLGSHSTLNVSIPDCNYYLSVSDLFRGLQALGKPGPIYLCRELISVAEPTWSSSEVGNQWSTGLPWRLRQWRIWLQCGRRRFSPWVSKIPLEIGMVVHSSILAWRIPWPEEPGGLQSMRSQRGGHDWATFTSSVHRSTVHNSQDMEEDCVHQPMNR